MTDPTKEFRDDPEPDDPGAVEEQVERIRAIRGREVLGYEGYAQAEHSGEPEEPDDDASLQDDFADNRPDERPDKNPE